MKTSKGRVNRNVKLALFPVTFFTMAVVGVLSLSYFDVRAFTGHPPSLASIRLNAPDILEIRWRMGEYHPESDMPGNYVVWSLHPFRKIHTFK